MLGQLDQSRAAHYQSRGSGMSEPTYTPTDEDLALVREKLEGITSDLFDQMPLSPPLIIALIVSESTRYLVSIDHEVAGAFLHALADAHISRGQDQHAVARTQTALNTLSDVDRAKTQRAPH